MAGNNRKVLGNSGNVIYYKKLKNPSWGGRVFFQKAAIDSAVISFTLYELVAMDLTASNRLESIVLI